MWIRNDELLRRRTNESRRRSKEWRHRRSRREWNSGEVCKRYEKQTNTHTGVAVVHVSKWVLKVVKHGRKMRSWHPEWAWQIGESPTIDRSPFSASKENEWAINTLLTPIRNITTRSTPLARVLHRQKLVTCSKTNRHLRGFCCECCELLIVCKSEWSVTWNQNGSRTSKKIWPESRDEKLQFPVSWRTQQGLKDVTRPKLKL